MCKKELETVNGQRQNCWLENRNPVQKKSKCRAREKQCKGTQEKDKNQGTKGESYSMKKRTEERINGELIPKEDDDDEEATMKDILTQKQGATKY